MKKQLLLLSMLSFGLIAGGYALDNALSESAPQITTTGALPTALPVQEAPKLDVPTNQTAISEVPQKSSFESLTEFTKLAAQQKTDWLNYMADETKQKVDLINKEHNDWSDFHIQQMNKLNGLTDWSIAAKEAFFKEKLEGALKLYKEHVAAWETFAKNEQESAKKLCDKHKADFAAKFEPKKVEEIKPEETKNEEPKKEEIRQDETKTEEKSEKQSGTPKKELKEAEEFDFSDDNFDDDEELE